VLELIAQADRAILDAIQSIHADWLDIFGSVVSILGQTELLAVIALAVAIVRLRARRRDWWIPLLLALVVAVEVVLKVVIPRTPPPPELSRGVDLLPFLRSPTTFSFPSGHVARTAFMLSALRWPAAVSVPLVLVMALTRVYLGDHWPSDVIAGWLLGYGVAWIARTIADRAR
jgi:membrane-associated phospholipid phosphatase